MLNIYATRNCLEIPAHNLLTGCVNSVNNKNGLIVISGGISIHESPRQKTYIRTCAPGEDSDQPAHSLFAQPDQNFHWCILNTRGRNVSSCRQRRFQSDCADSCSLVIFFTRRILQECKVSSCEQTKILIRQRECVV